MIAEREMRQMWGTPSDFWRVIDSEFAFERDACATAHNTKCKDFISPEQDALVTPWVDANARRVWANPGFSNLGPWVFRAFRESRKYPDALVALLAIPSVSARWWRVAAHASEIRFIAGQRIQIDPPPGIRRSSNARENCLLIFRGSHSGTPDMWTWFWNEKEVARRALA